MTLLVDGLSPKARTIVALLRENELRTSLKFDRLVHAQDQGDSYRAQHVVMWKFTNHTGKSTCEVHFAEDSTDHASSSEFNIFIPEESVGTNDLPSTLVKEKPDQETDVYAKIVHPDTSITVEDH